MKKLKKWIAFCLMLCCLMTLLPIPASAAQEQRSKGGKLIALTFDDGPGSYTNRLLDGLAERGVQVTFFTLGSRAEIYPNTIRRMYNEGHQVAQHTYDHPQLSAKTNEQIRWQVNHTKNILNEVLGQNFSYLVRPPYGDYNSRVLSQLGAPAIIWSIDPLDWKDRNAYTVRDRIVSNAFDGAIILAHDIHSTTVDGALMAIDSLLKQGYEFVTVNELFRRRGESLQAGSTYYRCKPNGTDLGAVSAPTFTAETVNGDIRLKLTADAGAKIYYTTDGSDPVTKGIKYTGAFSYRQGMTVKACAAFDLNGSRSKTVTLTPGQVLWEPTIAVKNGNIVLTNPNAGADLRYTTDGTLPDANSKLYTAPIACYNGMLRFCVIGTGIRTDIKTIYVTKSGNLYWDVPNTSWYYDEVDRAVTLGIFNGTDLYRFEPDACLTRAMFVTTLYRTMKLKDVRADMDNPQNFFDVPPGEWYTDAAAWASANGIVIGYEDGTFRPDCYISREEMCVILDRLMKLLGENTDGTAIRFDDEDSISDWAMESVLRMSACGLIEGQGNQLFAPQATTTRAEAAAVLLRLYDLIG